MCTARSNVAQPCGRPGDGCSRKKTDRIVQSARSGRVPCWCAKAKERFASGAIGELSLVEGSLGRMIPRGAWEYPLSRLVSENLDGIRGGNCTKKPLTHFSSHAGALEGIWNGLSPATCSFTCSVGCNLDSRNHEAPNERRLSAHLPLKDGRNTPDVHPVLFEYANVPGVHALDAGGLKPRESLGLWVPRASSNLRSLPSATRLKPGIDLAPSYYCYGLPSRLKTPTSSSGTTNTSQTGR